MRIIFVLPSKGGGGGAHSIVQEALGLTKLGVDVTIATPSKLVSQFRVRYPELQAHRVDNPAYDSEEDLAAILARHDLAIATTALSVRTVVHANEKLEAGKRLKLGYYVQDYEPLFYPPGTAEWTQARQSFDLMKGSLVFAKTEWLQTMVEANHNIGVRLVPPSIDHGVYYPVHREGSGPLRITAMVRPQTPRRAPKRTIRILERIAFELGSDVEVTYFGCESSDLEQIGIRPSASLTGLGQLSRTQVANTLRHSDLFLDLSDFQAFGRTGLEGMACGCVPVLPIFGGTDEYAKHGVNSYVVDTRSDEDIIECIGQFVGARPELRSDMRSNGIWTALEYSIGKAAHGEYEIFREYL